MSNDKYARLWKLQSKLNMLIMDGKRDPDELMHAYQGILSNGSTGARSWREEDGVVYFRVMSEGLTGEELNTHLVRNNFRVVDNAKQVLRSPDFKPSKPGTVFEVAVLKGCLFEDNNRNIKTIHHEVDKRKLLAPNAELACLIRLKFTNKEIKAMGLSGIVAMHEPIQTPATAQALLSLYCTTDGAWLGVYDSKPDYEWYGDIGFAFVVSQITA